MTVFCPACGHVYRTDSAKLKAFCVCCGMPTPKEASPTQEREYEAQRRKLIKAYLSPSFQ